MPFLELRITRLFKEKSCKEVATATVTTLHLDLVSNKMVARTLIANDLKYSVGKHLGDRERGTYSGDSLGSVSVCGSTHVFGQSKPVAWFHSGIMRGALHEVLRSNSNNNSFYYDFIMTVYAWFVCAMNHLNKHCRHIFRCTPSHWV